MQVVGLIVKMVVAEIFIADGRAALLERATCCGKESSLFAKPVCLPMDEFQEGTFDGLLADDRIAAATCAFSTKRLAFFVNQFLYAAFKCGVLFDKGF